MLKKYDNTIWYPFQQKIIDICKNEPDDRTIYIIEDEGGRNGKSTLCKYLDLVYNVLLADGKKDNIFNQLKTMMDTGDTPNIVILDIPRDNAEYLQYGTLEQLKNGQVYSGKYVGGKCIYNSPHMFIFTNFEVKRELWTKDRIKLINIKTGNITLLKEDEISDDEEEIDYKSKYYELQNENYIKNNIRIFNI